jgi:hypothetical protein
MNEKSGMRMCQGAGSEKKRRFAQRMNEEKRHGNVPEHGWKKFRRMVCTTHDENKSKRTRQGVGN